MYEYDLFAVINHEGQINNGHYTNYARFNDEVNEINHRAVILADIIFFGSGTALTTTSKSGFHYGLLLGCVHSAY